VETIQEKAKCVAFENKQLKRRLEEHSQEIESLELYIEKLENCINISTQVLETSKFNTEKLLTNGKVNSIQFQLP
jgi:ferritin-like metal-binding protein YciE